MKRAIQILVLIALLATSLPAASALTESDRPNSGVAPSEDLAGLPAGIRLVSTTGRTGDALAVAGQFLVKLDGARLLGLSTERVGFGWSLIEDNSSLPPAVRARQLSAELGVLVVPNGVSHLLDTNTEPDAGFQWPLYNTTGLEDADIDGEEAWDLTQGSGVVVAVLDSGLDLDHPDLAAAVWTNDAETPSNGQDDDNNGFVDDVNGWDFQANDNNPDDAGGNGHGSFVSGIIGAPRNGVGIAGVAPQANLMPLRVCAAFCLDSDVIAALDYAAANGAEVANLSLGRGPGDTFGDDLFEAAFTDAAAAGLTVVAAAGNDGADNDTIDPDPFTLPNWPAYPASFDIPGLISVGMSNDLDELDVFSNYGATTVDLAAPGVAIYSSIPPSASFPSGYATGDGTSFAAPHVAGVAALVLAQDGCLTPAQVESRILRSVDKVPALSGLVATGGRLNAHRALTEFRASASTTYGGAPHTVDFAIDVCSGSFPWEFGDGATASDFDPSHTYTEIGLYEATVELDGATRTFDIVVGVPFTDTDGNPFEEEILWLSAAGVTLGCDTAGPTFCPDDVVTRGQMASFLARALELPPASGDYFTDDSTSTHQDNINRLREAGVTLGCDIDGTLFCPDEEITREQMATFLVRGYGLAPSSNNLFSDTSGTHVDNINALAASGITLGCETGLFCPKDPVPRRQMAAFLFRAEE